MSTNKRGLLVVPGSRPGEVSYRLEEGDDPEAVGRVIRAAAPDRLLKLVEVQAMVGMKKTRIFELISAGKFPAQIKEGRASLWSEKDIQSWIAARKSADK